ncbi:MAG TPA: right-handed parallel beta-helix repeat-containing protein [Steroidobacteraceae bacterium]|nr:right-handed parallel beta-helix repeat-containing protein [Steroidobacteraceae bacterium]
MTPRQRTAVAIGVFVVLAVVVAAGRWYESQHTRPQQVAARQVLVHVTNAGDRGPGTLREALFIVAAASGPAGISIDVPHIQLYTALPALVNGHGVRIQASSAGAQIDARALSSGPVLDVSGPDTTVEGLSITGCPAAGVLVRATRFHLSSSTISSCDVGIEIAENASQTLLDRNRFTKNRVAVRFAASGRDSAVTNNEFVDNKDAGVWAVRSAPDSHDEPIDIHDNKLTGNGTGIVAGNVPVLIEHDDFINVKEAGVHLIGKGAVVRGNHIDGGAAMGIVAEGAHGAVIEGNELEGLAAYGVMVRNSSDILVKSNRLHNCGYGFAFVLGDAKGVTTVVDNTIIEPKFNGIDIVGDSPILRRNQVLRPHAFALHVEDFQPPAGGDKVQSKPFLEDNTFEKPVGATKATAADTAQLR